MILTPTLFVLGAGASKPYGFPTGEELRTLICDAQNESNAAARAIAEGGYFSDSDIKNVAQTFSRSNIKSIDEFLGRLPHLAEVGKALIAANICSREEPDAIFSEQNTDHWYRLLGTALTEDTVNGQDITRNCVRFITFNYDRSLEFFLHELTKNAYSLNDAAAYGLWSKLGIMHLYGSVGKFGYADGSNDFRPYSSEIRSRELHAAAGSINIIPDGREDAGSFKLARNWFDWAQRVYILGFSFDRLNCNRLNFASVIQVNRGNKAKLPKIVASGFGLTPTELARAQQLLLGTNDLLHTFERMCAMTLRMSGFPD